MVLWTLRHRWFNSLLIAKYVTHNNKLPFIPPFSFASFFWLACFLLQSTESYEWNKMSFDKDKGSVWSIQKSTANKAFSLAQSTCTDKLSKLLTLSLSREQECCLLCCFSIAYAGDVTPDNLINLVEGVIDEFACKEAVHRRRPLWFVHCTRSWLS